MPENSGHENIIKIEVQGQSLNVFYRDEGTGFPLVFLHGWGCDHQIFLPLSDSFQQTNRVLSIDFPGFGKSDLPPQAWGVSDYMLCLRQILEKLEISNALFICHSFGGRVALRLAHAHPELVAGLVLIASAGLKRKVPFLRRMRIKSIRNTARLAEKCLPGFMGKPIKDKLYNKIASRDYQNAGELKPTFVKVVNDDLRELLPQIQSPSLLLYGSDDQETPPALGQTIAGLLPNSQYVEFPGFDHISILNQGRHQLEHQITQFKKGLSL